jgi:hypothetical protein
MKSWTLFRWRPTKSPQKKPVFATLFYRYKAASLVRLPIASPLITA